MTGMPCSRHTPCVVVPPQRHLPRTICLVALFAISLVQSAGRARGELTVIEHADGQDNLSVYQMTVTPAPEPTPALKHRLVLRELEYRPGNAAVHYLRAYPEGGFERVWRLTAEEFGEEEFNHWYSFDTPLGDLPLDKVRTAAASFHGMIEAFIVPASQRRDCDWGHGIAIEGNGPEIYSFLLPEIQSMRGMSRALRLVTRVAIADGDYERAIDLLRMNYRLGVNVARSPFIVSGLVGLAVCGMSNAEVIELIAAPDSPNLYWALAELPTPMVDLRDSIRFEMGLGPRVFPIMLNAESAEHSPAEWARLMTKSLAHAEQFGDGAPSLTETALQAAATGFAIMAYPDAKRRLIAGGMDPQRVEQMPVGQVIAVDALHEYRRIADELEKWIYLPYRVADRNDSQHFMDNVWEGGFGQRLAELILPALMSARDAQMRLQWQTDALRVIEAIRMHAAETGHLPRTLAAIEVVPVPDNPVTGHAYAYHRDGETAILELPFSDGFNVAFRFEIKLAKP